MATIKVNNPTGCSHIDIDVTIDGVVHTIHKTKKELVAAITEDDLKVMLVVRNAGIYYRKRKAEGANYVTIIAEIEAKEFSL